MDERNLSVHNIWGFAGPIWMTIVGSVFAISGLASLDASMGAGNLVMAVIGCGLIGGAIALFIGIGRRNSRIRSVLIRQHFRAKCAKCGQEFDYTGLQVLKHRSWPTGYIDCPHCRAHNGHVISNLLEIQQ
jgi:DNA-directed RNA polymerase subunit RPC12/RpoP